MLIIFLLRVYGSNQLNNNAYLNQTKFKTATLLKVLEFSGVDSVCFADPMKFVEEGIWFTVKGEECSFDVVIMIQWYNLRVTGWGNYWSGHYGVGWIMG